jgi:hypothetical protein
MVVCVRGRGAGEKCVTGHSRLRREVIGSLTICSNMTRANIHRPPSQAIIAELVRAGVSHETAMAMERWKAQEVLELLRFGPEAAVPALAGAKIS